MNPRAIKAPCVTFSDGRTREGSCHGVCVLDAIRAGWFDSEEAAFSAIRIEGFITHGGEILSREDALTRAVELREMTRAHYERAARESGVKGPADWLESLTYDDVLCDVAEGITA